MAEKRETAVQPWQLGAAYGYEFSNPYLNVSGVTVSGNRNLSRVFSLGAQIEKFFAAENDLTTAVQKNLGTDRISQTVHKPSYAFFGTISLTPLAGQLNLFSYKSLPFDFLVTLGAGETQYAGQSLKPSVLWSISPQFMLSPQLGMNFSVGQEVESPLTDSSLAKFEGKVGTFVRF